MKKHLNMQNGTVIAVYQNQFTIYANGQNTNCRLAGKIQRSELLVGDEVTLSDGMIHSIQERKNHFSRSKAGPKSVEQKIAANIDLIMAVMAVQNPAPKWNLLDRYLAAAENAELPLLVCLTKMDLVQQEHPEYELLLHAAALYQSLGYPVILTSTQENIGLDSLRGILQGKSTLMIGKSGVGKSSLMNALFPDVERSVGQVGQESGKGRHTTSSAWMHVIDPSTRLIDTPGSREFGLWVGEAQDLQYSFVEMQPYIGTCRFGLSCLHDEEPGCAIRQAVMTGAIDPRRYQSYLKLLDEQGAG